MIAFWNRHEVYMGTDTARFNQVLDVLAAERIKYKYRIENRAGASRQMIERGSLIYYVYVHRNDAERADGVLRNLR